MAVDNNSNRCAGSPASATPGSTCTPFQDRIYVTWTEFAPNGSAFIYEAYSADYGEHFSPRHLVSLNSATLCPNDYGLGTAGHVQREPVLAAVRRARRRAVHHLHQLQQP